MNIVIDFDGTCITHEFPKVGKEIGAVRVLKLLVENGHNLILFTMRSDSEKGTFKGSKKFPEETGGPYLTDAVNWFKKHHIPLYGIQSNPDQKSWTTSPKPYGSVYIDDNALGCPLKYEESLSDEPFVDWETVEDWLIVNGYIKITP